MENEESLSKSVAKSAKSGAKHEHYQVLPDESKPPALKKSRLDVSEEPGYVSPNSATLPIDALMVVMEFLHPRDLLSTAFSCKALSDVVTTKMVIQSALIHGGHAKKSMEELLTLMANRSIHVPSPQRLLRISSGKYCEFCLEDKVNHVRPGIGVFACWECVTNGSSLRGSLTKVWKRGWVRYSKNEENRVKYDAIFEHPRVASSEYGANNYFWSCHRFDRSGERIGPIVTWDDVDEMCNHFESADEMTDGGIDNYLVNNLNAPPTDRYAEFTGTLLRMQQRAEAAISEREASKRAKKEKTKEKKLANAKKMLDDLTELIDKRFRDFSLKHVENIRFHDPNAKLSTPCLCIETSFIDSLLEPYIRTPSKMKKKVLKEVAEKINDRLRMIADKGFPTMDFLSDSDPFEKALKQYLDERFPNLQAMFEIGHYVFPSPRGRGCSQIFVNKIDEKFLSLLEEDRLLEAVGYLVGNNYSPTLLKAIGSSSPAAIWALSLDDSTLKVLAATVWDKCLRCSDDTHYRRIFMAGQEMIEKALAALDEYDKWLLNKYDSEARRKFQLKSAAGSYYLERVMEKKFDYIDSKQENAWGVHDMSSR